jgi:hypothetical protein
MPKIFTDLEYALCIYLTGNLVDPDEGHWTNDSQPHAYLTCGNGSPTFVFWKILLSLLPYYLRLMQSARIYRDTAKTKHIFNGLKYLLQLSVGILATVKQRYVMDAFILTAWFYVSIVATLYSLYWDVIMDWGLGHLRAEHPFLRSSDTLYFPPYVYYVAIVLDAFFRLGWAIYISPGNMVLQQHFILLLGCVELVRRFLWSIFRVEWEYVCLLSEEAVQQRRAKRLNALLDHSQQQSRGHISQSVDSFFIRHDSDPEMGTEDSGAEDMSNSQLPSQESGLGNYNEEMVYMELSAADVADDDELDGDVFAAPEEGARHKTAAAPYQASALETIRSSHVHDMDHVDLEDTSSRTVSKLTNTPVVLKPNLKKNT